MTGAIFGLRPQIGGQPAHLWVLGKAPTRLQQFHATQHTTKLILPTTTCGEHLFEHEGAMTNLVLIPTQAAEIVERTQHGSSQDAAGA